MEFSPVNFQSMHFNDVEKLIEALVDEKSFKFCFFIETCLFVSLCARKINESEKTVILFVFVFQFWTDIKQLEAKYEMGLT